ncbi:hypothetical protein D1BOALGB6SA_5222 [Olavius sp. associated proteobacterium Delta 1]|nr:hypothetical protein D1BOALGB6SA_5222 [Olavius sp. associated proteobacterium Delta 1]
MTIKKKRIILSILGAVLLTVLIVVALLPGIVSSDMMKPYVMQTVNQQIPGQLQVKAWSLSWFGKIELKEIVYDNHQNNLLARIAEFKTSSGLWNLVLGGGNLGTVEVVDPAVVLYFPEKSETTKPKDSQPAPQPPEPKPNGGNRTGSPTIYGQFRITNGSLHTVAVGGDEKVIAKNLDAVLDAPGPQDPITYQFSVKSGDNSGQAAGEGTLTLAANDPLNIQKIQSDSKLSIDSWELEDVFAIIASRVSIPAANGRLNANLTLTGSPAENLQLLSNLSIPKLKLHGGPLGSDTPVVNGISVNLDASGDSGGLSFNNLVFDSSLANGSAKGRFAARGIDHLAGNAEINLAAVFTQIPGTLKLREGTRITEGNMALSARLNTSGESTSFDGSARIDRIKGVSNNKKVAWDQPVTLNAKGEMRPDGLQLDNLSLRSAFLNAEGQGNLSNMKARLAADIKAALKEFKKFIEIKQWDGGGNLKVNLELKEKSKKISHAKLNLAVKNFVLSRNSKRILLKQDILTNVTSDIDVGKTLAASNLIQLQAKVESLLATGNINANNVTWNTISGLPDASALKLDTNIDLRQLSSLLRNLNMLTPKTSLAGQSAIQTSGTLHNGKLTLSSTTMDTRKLVYRQDKQTIRENRLSLATKGKLNFNTRSVFLAPVDITGQAGAVRIPELKIADWANAQKDMKTHGTADLDLNNLVNGYGDFIQLPPKTQISGKGTFDIDVDFSNPKAQYLKLRGHLAPFKLASPTLPTISEKKVSLDADLKRSPDGKQLTIDNFKVNSNALKLTANGKLNQTGKNKVFEAKGTMAPDLSLVSEYLKKTGKGPIEITGKKATPFTIKLVSKGDRWEDPLQHLNFSGALHVDSVMAYGLSLTPQEVPIRLVNASADAHLESPANGGTLAMQPILDLRKEPYILSFKKNIDLLKDIKITQGLIDGLLATLHPLFKDAVMPAGILGLYMENFKWPLSENGKNQASFAGTLHLNGIRLNSTPFLSQLLGMGGIKEREIILNDQSFEFRARKGRVTCSPITMDVAEYKFTIHGSIGFDDTLDFIARIPVTSKMVGKDAYQFLKGTTIKVPIRGSASNPKINQAAFQDATGDLMQQVMQKNVEQGVQNLFKNLFKKKD